MVGVSWGKPPIFFCHRKLASLVRAIVSTAVHGTDPLAQTFTGRSTSECLNFFFSNAQIEISINWCMERGTHEPS